MLSDGLFAGTFESLCSLIIDTVNPIKVLNFINETITCFFCFCYPNTNLCVQANRRQGAALSVKTLSQYRILIL